MDGFRLLYPPDYDRDQERKMKDFQFVSSLQIDSMVILVNERFRGLVNLSLDDFFTTDEKVLDYRLAVDSRYM